MWQVVQWTSSGRWKPCVQQNSCRTPPVLREEAQTWNLDIAGIHRLDIQITVEHFRLKWGVYLGVFDVDCLSYLSYNFNYWMNWKKHNMEFHTIKWLSNNLLICRRLLIIAWLRITDWKDLTMDTIVCQRLLKICFINLVSFVFAVDSWNRQSKASGAEAGVDE